MSQLKAAALRLAQKNPEFREALKTKIAATRRRKKKAPKKNKGKPTKIVESIGKFVVKNSRHDPYAILADHARDAGSEGSSKPTLESYTLDDLANLDRMAQMKLADKIAEWFAKKVEKQASPKGFWPDLPQARLTVFDLMKGEISFAGRFDGEDFIDEDGDIEVPADEDMVQSEIYEVMRAQKLKNSDSQWEFSDADYGGMTGLRYEVRFSWEFDPTELTWMVLDKRKAQKIVDDAYERAKAQLG